MTAPLTPKKCVLNYSDNGRVSVAVEDILASPNFKRQVKAIEEIARMNKPLTPRERVEALYAQLDEGEDDSNKIINTVFDFTRQLAAELEEAKVTIAKQHEVFTADLTAINADACEQRDRAEAAERQLAEKDARIAELEGAINAPEIHYFIKAVQLEAVHQRKRWGTEHDAGKEAEDWLWLCAYLATKATQAHRYGDQNKYLHHIITCAATCLNWHANATGMNTVMRAGVDGGKFGELE